MSPNVKLIESSVCESSLKPCIVFRLKITAELDEVPIALHGLLYSEDGKLISYLSPGAFQPSPQGLNFNLMARMSAEYESLRVKGTRQEGYLNLITF